MHAIAKSSLTTLRAFKGAHPPVYELFIVLQAATGRASLMIVLGKPSCRDYVIMHLNSPAMEEYVARTEREITIKHSLWWSGWYPPTKFLC